MKATHTNARTHGGAITSPAALALLSALLLLAPLFAPRPAHAQGGVAPPARPPARTQARPAPTPAPPAGAQAPKPAVTNGAANAQKPARPERVPLAGRVVGEDGGPVAGVNVYAATRAQTTGPRSPNTVTSDEGGNFVFPALDPGLYTVGANLPGYINESDPQTGRVASTYRPGEQALVRLVKGGVVTGSVVDQQGQPLVALGVRAMRVRDLDGRAPQGGSPFSGEDRTDDRGVYRIYGLQPGVYVVYASGLQGGGFATPGAYGGDVPTFYPSGTRDTAAEVTVRAGQETAGIDIRYREEQGRRVTGTVELPAGSQPDFGLNVALTYAGTLMPAGGVGLGLGVNSPERSFSIEGVADGDYDIRAAGGGREGLSLTSAPQRVSVRGADVTGLRLTLTPLASVSGSVRIEPASEAERAGEPCKAVRTTGLPQETLVTASPDLPRVAAGATGRPVSRPLTPRETTPDETGDFSLRALEPARYRLSFQLFDESLYVRAVQLPGAAPNAASAAARDVFELRPGQQLSGVAVRLAEGAAGFGGRVATAEGASPQTPPPTRVHLVPQERERAEETLRYYEASVSPDGAFSFKNLAPGRYLLLARAEAESPEAPRRRAAFDADTRARLRREAEAANVTVELQPCQRTSDYALRFPQSK
ncbi:MAG TPA: carboxypeptidase regulatory-like domain-containing protein [Pyrinomonadaceae bacterium]